MWTAKVTYASAYGLNKHDAHVKYCEGSGETLEAALRSVYGGMAETSKSIADEWTLATLNQFDPLAALPAEIIVAARGHTTATYVQIYGPGNTSGDNAISLLCADVDDGLLHEVRAVLTDSTDPGWPMTWTAVKQGRPLWAALGASVGQLASMLARGITEAVLEEHGGQREGRYVVNLHGEKVQLVITIAPPGRTTEDYFTVQIDLPLVQPVMVAAEILDREATYGNERSFS